MLACPSDERSGATAHATPPKVLNPDRNPGIFLGSQLLSATHLNPRNMHMHDLLHERAAQLSRLARRPQEHVLLSFGEKFVEILLGFWGRRSADPRPEPYDDQKSQKRP